MPDDVAVDAELLQFSTFTRPSISSVALKQTVEDRIQKLTLGVQR